MDQRLSKELTITTDRVFNTIVNSICNVKGLEWFSTSEYKSFEIDAKLRIRTQLERLIEIIK